MTEMKRLLDDAIAPEIAELLRSAELDEPSTPERRRAQLLASIAAAPVVTGVLAPATTAASPAAWSRLGKLLRASKWSVPLIGVLAAALALSSASPGTPTAGPSAPPEERAPAHTALADRAQPEASVPGVRVEDLPSAAPGIEARAVPKKNVDPPRATPAFDEEIAAIDAARAALASSRPDETLARLQRYRKTFGAPHFADEADVLEIQALAALGRPNEARHHAERFLAAHPDSPYARRVRTASGLDR